MPSHYETLGVPPGASADDVKRAYRKAAGKAHPDRGGDTDTMKAVNKAYEVLIDPRRRIEYDETGNAEGETPISEQAQRTLATFFAAALGKDAPNLLIAVREMLAMQTAEARQTEAAARRQRAKLLARRDKIKVKDGGQNLVHGLIDAAVVDLDAAIAKALEQLEVTTLAGKMADGYESSEDVELIMPKYRGTTFSFGTKS